jgi:hypothetical protein
LIDLDYVCDLDNVGGRQCMPPGEVRR